MKLVCSQNVLNEDRLLIHIIEMQNRDAKSEVKREQFP